MSSMQQLIGDELCDTLKQATHTLALNTAESEPPSPLNPVAKKAALLEKQANAAFEKLCKEYMEIGQLLMQTIEFLSHTREEINFEAVFDELNDFGKKINSKTLNSLANQVSTDDALNPQAIFQLSKDTINALFEASAHLFAEKRFNEATKAFSILCNLVPDEYDHWVAYGHSATNNKQYDTSIVAYYMATSLRPDIPWPLIWAANACEAMGEKEASNDLLTRAYEVANESPEPEFKQLAPKIKERLTITNNKK